MTGPAVVVDGVWKKFRRGEQHDALRDAIPALGQRLFRRTRDAAALTGQEFWVLQDVSFEVQPGEALGIIGPNGAGKSTILKLLTRILRPTRGICRLQGRTGALIEVAAGFHPDLTGRENVFLQAAIMGMKRGEIARKLEDIVEFAGVRDFIDTPIKRYSSGMNARLGFSIAAHLDPEVLLIDEVLAVGDMAFQERCYERMRHFRDSGVAIVLISHNLNAISALCGRTLVVRRGEVQTIGPTDASLAAYARAAQSTGEGTDAASGAIVELLTPAMKPVTSVTAGDPLVVRAVVKLDPFDGRLAFGLRIRRIDTGEVVFFTTSASLGCPSLPGKETSLVETTWRFTANLTRGLYSIELGFFNHITRETILRLTHASQFAVSESDSEDGVAHLAPSLSSRSLTGPSAGACSPTIEHRMLA